MCWASHFGTERIALQNLTSNSTPAGECTRLVHAQDLESQKKSNGRLL